MTTLTCPACGVSREVDPAKVPRARARVRCQACSHVFEIDGAALLDAGPALELDWKDQAPRIAEPGSEAGPVAPAPAPPAEPAPEATSHDSEDARPQFPSWILWRALPAVVALLGLHACAVRACDRPQALGLRWTTEGASLARASRVLVFLHGFQGSGARSEWVAEELVERARGANVAVVLPDGPYAYWFGRAWWVTNNPAEHEDARRRVLALVDELATDHGLTRDRLYVGGFSQGAGLALEIAAERPTRVGGAVLLSGRYALPASPLATPVFFAHGSRDSLCPFGEAAAVANQMREAGTPVEFLSFDDDHVIPPEVQSAVAGVLVRGLQRPEGPGLRE